MTTASSSIDSNRGDLIGAAAFAQRCFDQWHTAGLIHDGSHQAISMRMTKLRASLEAGEPILEEVQLRPADICWSCKHPLAADARDCDECGAPAHTPETQNLRYFIFVCFEVKKLSESGVLSLSAADGCLADANARHRGPAEKTRQ